MNRQLWFLAGHLSGLVIGAALVWMYFGNTPRKSPPVYTIPRIPVVSPVGYQGLPNIPNVGQLPDGWERRYFNGQPYYIIPLNASVRSAT